LSEIKQKEIPLKFFDYQKKGGNMSTRCQVKVIQKDFDSEESVTLYHHYDGYPENMIPLFVKASQYKGCKSGRAGKVASILCDVDPLGFEPESGHQLHGDLSYYYKLYINIYGKDGQNWELEVYEVNGSIANMLIVEKRQSLAVIAKKWK